jgi:hypothetical protein
MHWHLYLGEEQPIVREAICLGLISSGFFTTPAKALSLVLATKLVEIYNYMSLTSTLVTLSWHK